MRFLLIIIAFGICFTSLETGLAQPRPDDNSIDKPEEAEVSKRSLEWLKGPENHVHEFSLIAGYGFDSFKLWGKTPNATLGQLGLGYNRKLFKLGKQLLEYRLELNVFSKITYPDFEPQRERESLSGFGLTPLGLRMNFRQGETLQPFLGTSAGFMYLEGPFPDERGERFNYTLRAGLGIEILINRSSSLSLGYTYFHISNGDHGEVNPGIDSGFLSASLTFF